MSISSIKQSFSHIVEDTVDLVLNFVEDVTDEVTEEPWYIVDKVITGLVIGYNVRLALKGNKWSMAYLAITAALKAAEVYGNSIEEEAEPFDFSMKIDEEPLLHFMTKDDFAEARAAFRSAINPAF